MPGRSKPVGLVVGRSFLPSALGWAGWASALLARAGVDMLWAVLVAVWW